MGGIRIRGYLSVVGKNDFLAAPKYPLGNNYYAPPSRPGGRGGFIPGETAIRAFA